MSKKSNSKIFIWLMIGAAVLIGLALLVTRWVTPAGATDVCPNDGDWDKVDGLSGTTYTYTPPESCEVTDNCYKHSTYVHYGSGATVTADEHCSWEWAGWHFVWRCHQYDLSHASFKLACEVSPTPTPTPTATPTPTPTPEPTLTPTPTPTPSPTPPVCDEQQYSCEQCSEHPNDDWCGEYKFDYCSKNYACHYEEANGELKLLDYQTAWVCACEPPPVTPTPTPAPTSEPKPEGCTQNCNPPAPVCSAEAVVNQPANPHVYRQNGTALVKWVPTGGNKANIYYKQCSSADWQYSVQVDNTGYKEINDLGTMDVCFAIEQVNDCGGGVITSARSETIVDGATSHWVLFR